MGSLKQLTVFLAAFICAVAALPATSDSSHSGRYIVTLKRGLSDGDVSSHMEYTRDMHSRNLRRRGRLVTTWGSGGVKHTFNIRDHNSYSGVFDRDTVAQIESHVSVAAVEPVKRVRTWERTAQALSPWGLGSISHNVTDKFPIETYHYDDAGMGEDVWVYVLDTGIRITHEEFEGRAVWGKSFVLNETDTDHNGHGSHVAGTIGSKTFGVAKKANLIAVKIVDAAGAGDSDNMLDAVTWAYDNAKAHDRVHKSVINISVGLAESSDALVDAIDAVFEAGMVVVAAAGNENTNASFYSPGNAAGALTVGAVSVDSGRASYSNWGEAVDIFAPGDMINSLGFDTDVATVHQSGTSMATPHVTGLCVYVKSLYGIMDSAEVVKKVLEMAAVGVVNDTRSSTNALAYNGYVL